MLELEIHNIEVLTLRTVIYTCNLYLLEMPIWEEACNSVSRFAILQLEEKSNYKYNKGVEFLPQTLIF